MNLPPDVLAEKAIQGERVRLERRLLALSWEIAQKLDRDPPAVIRELSAYKRAGGERRGEMVNGRVNPGLLSFERLEKSVADGESWLEDLGGADATKTDQ